MTDEKFPSFYLSISDPVGLGPTLCDEFRQHDKRHYGHCGLSFVL